MHRIPFLDAWRGCAILFVLLGHYGPPLGINTGRLGVELFFVLSGRLMAEILFVKNAPLPRFFKRRFMRVYPAFAVFAAFIWLTAGWRGGDPTAGQMISAITFTSNYTQLWIGRSPVLDHIWSLCIEEHIYLLLGIIALINRRRPMPVKLILSGLSVAMAVHGGVLALVGYDYPAIYWRSDIRGASILLGAAAYLQARDWFPPILQRWWSGAVLILLAIAFSVDGVPDPLKYSFGTAFLAVGMVSTEAIIKDNSNILLKLLGLVGLLSFSLYLWQQPFYKAGGGIYNLGLAVGCALVSYLFVEKGFSKSISKLWVLLISSKGRSVI